MKIPLRTMMAQRGNKSGPAFAILVAALLTAFLCYLVADPDLDLYAHYDKGNHQVQVQLTVLSAAQRAAQLRLRVASLLPFFEFGVRAARQEPRRHETALHWDLAELAGVSSPGSPVLLI